MPESSSRDLTLQRLERTYVRLALLVLFGIVLFVGLCWAGSHAYVRWQEHSLMRQAHAALQRGDLRWASLAAQRAYGVNSSSLDACRTLAEIAEKGQDEGAIDWRRRVVEIDPHSLFNQLALATTALRFAKPAIAADALAAVPAEKRNDDGYQAVAARVSLAKNDLVATRVHLAAAVRLASNNPDHQLALAQFDLASKDDAQRAEGRKVAGSLRTKPTVRREALVLLINDALRRQSLIEATKLTNELAALPNSSFADEILTASFQHTVKEPTFTASVTRLEEQAASSPEKAAQLIAWMNTEALSLLAIDWSKKLPANLLDNLAVRVALGDSYAQSGNWKGLEDILQHGNWTGAESLNLAWRAKVADESSDAVGREKFWTEAVAKARGQSEQSNLLASLAFQWHWPEKATAVLWTCSEQRETQLPALKALYLYYTKQRDTTGTYRVLGKLVELLPDDLSIRNNFILISLLLQTEPARMRTMAQELNQKEPGNGSFASTYAFALYQTGDTAGALRVFSALSPEQLRDPAIALYYGVILAGAGHKQEAAEALAKTGGAKLLPEERALVESVRAKLAQQ